MEMVISHDPVTSDYNLKTLRQLNDAVKSQVCGLKSLGVDSSSYDSLLLSILLNNLPHETRLINSRKIGDENCHLFTDLGVTYGNATDDLPVSYPSELQSMC